MDYCVGCGRGCRLECGRVAFAGGMPMSGTQRVKPWLETLEQLEWEQNEGGICLSLEQAKSLLTLHQCYEELECWKRTVIRQAEDAHEYVLAQINCEQRERIQELEAKVEQGKIQWAKTNGEYERVSKEHSRLVTKHAELEAEVARLKTELPELSIPCTTKTSANPTLFKTRKDILSKERD